MGNVAFADELIDELEEIFASEEEPEDDDDLDDEDDDDLDDDDDDDDDIEPEIAPNE
jgi:hypothetical protein